MARFQPLQMVTHRKGGKYKIICSPDKRLLEDCAEPFYEYQSNADGQVWIRKQSEVEDGRFTAI